MKLLLTIDVGNTHITVGAFEGSRLRGTWRLQSDRHATADEIGLQLRGLIRHANVELREVIGVSLASVVPSLDHPLVDACRRYLHLTPVVVNSDLDLGLTNRYRRPDEVGADRLVNAVAVHAVIKGPAIVVDFGTATTFDCVNARGDYLGGAICPGMELAGEWLATHTAKLPRVIFDAAPKQALGKTTKESLQSGLFWGYIGLVEGLLKRLAVDMKSKPTVVATGGLSVLIGPHIARVSKILPDLTLDGLRLLWERNQK